VLLALLPPSPSFFVITERNHHCPQGVLEWLHYPAHCSKTEHKERRERKRERGRERERERERERKRERERETEREREREREKERVREREREREKERKKEREGGREERDCIIKIPLHSSGQWVRCLRCIRKWERLQYPN
jgi:hypothetical protein